MEVRRVIIELDEPRNPLWPWRAKRITLSLEEVDVIVPLIRAILRGRPREG